MPVQIAPTQGDGVIANIMLTIFFIAFVAWIYYGIKTMKPAYVPYYMRGKKITI